MIVTYRTYKTNKNVAKLNQTIRKQKFQFQPVKEKQPIFFLSKNHNKRRYAYA